MCPVCKRDLAPTLSICLTCGAMINDTVREELETKISKTPAGVAAASISGKLTPGPKLPTPKPPIAQPTPPVSESISKQQVSHPVPKTAAPPVNSSAAQAAKPKPMMGTRFETNDLHAKKTSPTLVEFQTKKATVPEWRLQLQNSVRQKVGTSRRTDADESSQAKPRTTNGANALKVEFVEEEHPRHQNPRVAKALKRIEESRRTFSSQPVPEQSVHVGKAQPAKNHRFNVVARSPEPGAPKPAPRATVNPSPKPMLVSPLRIEKKGFDTNKLPPLSKAGAVSEKVELPISDAVEEPLRHNVELRVDSPVEIEEIEQVETDEIEDLAPLSMRFSAGLFDFIIGTFATLLVLSPFMMAGGNWVSLSGFFAIAASLAIVMFLYLTITIAYFGRSFGMRLFSLELVDIEENAYPTLHQAAVSSAVFLLSFAVAGIGFLPVFFNEERRAAHDILSGTILVREY